MAQAAAIHTPSLAADLAHRQIRLRRFQLVQFWATPRAHRTGAQMISCRTIAARALPQTGIAHHIDALKTVAGHACESASRKMT
jgi:hypothetical protein